MISMQVVKRDGSKEDVSFDKVLNRIRIVAKDLEVNSTLIAQRTLLRIYDGVKTSELDELAAQLSISLMTTNPDYGILASRIIISNHHRNTSDKFTDVVFALANQTLEKTGEKVSNVSQELVEICEKYGTEINAKIDYERDYLFDYFGFKTLEKLQYLLRDTKGKTLERPQHLIMRVSLALWGSVDLNKAFETYDFLSQKYFIHATPTNFNAGTPRQQLSSCFLLAMKADSIVGIYDTLKECAQISKHAGGIGLHIHNIRAKGSLIKGTNGTSNGIVPMLRNFNDTARYVDQGGGKRNGSFAIYLEPWHADVEDFLKLKLNTGSEEERCRDLFYALWIPDLFMERVEKNEPWTLFCPSEAPGLADVYGDEFKELYERYEKEGRGRKQIDAQKLWFKVLDSQIETGTPYLLYKDAANKKSNQKNLGTIKSSNLCVAPETLIMTDKGHLPIASLVNETVNVWNGNKWSKTVVKQTGTNQKLINVIVKTIYKIGVESWTDTRNLTCTPYHKFILKDGQRINASELYPEIELKEWFYNNIDGNCFERGIIQCNSKVISINDMGRIDDTYCFNEPENHAGVFNGILTGNCTEIIEYSSSDESAVCNLASIALPAYVDQKKKIFNYEKLREVVKVAIKNLNRVIDINYYPTPETKNSNMRHRPVGLGVQGLADVFAMMRVPWESDKAADINQRIFEHMYYAAIEASSEIAEKEGTYSTYEGSPISKGHFQYDLWNVTPLTDTDGTLNWSNLKEKVKKNGIRNSLLMAPMPTASTSQILGYTECFEPVTSNIYTRRTLAGEFIIVNKYLMKDLEKLELWNEDMKQQIILRNGSIQDIEGIPDSIKRLYKTAWEIKQKTLIDMAAARGAFICQSQSLNLFVADPNYAKLTSMHFYSWKKGLKTGIYYLRTRAPVMAQKFTVDPELQKAAEKSEQERLHKKYAPDEGCTMCSA
jgi:ribonucleotide reductase alpha subunit